MIHFLKVGNFHRTYERTLGGFEPTASGPNRILPRNLFTFALFFNLGLISVAVTCVYGGA